MMFPAINKFGDDGEGGSVTTNYSELVLLYMTARLIIEIIILYHEQNYMTQYV